MIKYIKYAFFASLLIISVFSFTNSASAQTTTTVACPVGYTCTQVTVSCPTGYKCTPVPCPVGYKCTPVDNGSLKGCPEGYFCEPLDSSSGGGSGSGGSSSCYNYTRNLTAGARGEDVVALQKFLISNGFDIPALTTRGAGYGYFGASTKVALSAYQLSEGIPSTGFFGPLTMESVNRGCGSGNIENSSNINVDLVSVDTVLGNTGSGTFSIKFKVGAINDTVYISSVASDVVNYLVDKAGVVLEGKGNNVIATILDHTDSNLTPKGNYKIEEGEQHVFTLTVVVAPTETNLFRLRLQNINYNLADVSKPNLRYNLPDNFQTSYLIINGNYNTSDYDASVIIHSSNLSLSYDSDRNESALTSKFVFSVDGGDNGLYLYKNNSGVGFHDSGTGKDQNLNNVTGYLENNSHHNTTTVTDKYGGSWYFVRPGFSSTLSQITSVDPKKMFAGTYYASLRNIYTKTELNANNSVTLKIPSNKTNSVTIVGEKSPYITSITPTVQSGGTIFISGERLVGSYVVIDGQKTSIVTSGSNSSYVSFVNPTRATGKHTLQLSSPTTGDSNIIYFEVAESEDKAIIVSSLKSTYKVGDIIYIKWEGKSNTGYNLYLSGGGHEEGYTRHIESTNFFESNQLNYKVTSSDLPTPGHSWGILVCPADQGITNPNSCGLSDSFIISETITTPPSATIDRSSMTAKSSTPTISGYAYNTTEPLTVSVKHSSGDKVLFSTRNIRVGSDNKWLTTVVQPLEDGRYTIEVYSGNTLLTTAPLVVDFSPNIGDLSSYSGVIGDTITIDGANFSSSGNTVYLQSDYVGEVSIKPNSESTTQISFTIPRTLSSLSAYGYAGTYKLYVKTSGSVKSNESQFSITDTQSSNSTSSNTSSVWNTIKSWLGAN